MRRMSFDMENSEASGLPVELLSPSLRNISVKDDINGSATDNGTGFTRAAEGMEFLRRLQLYYSSSVISMGLVGSALAVIVFFRVGCNPRNKASYIHYLVGLNVACVLYCFTLLLEWLRNVHVDVYDITGICQHVAFLTHASGFLYKWFLVSLCLDRCLAVSPKPSTRKFCTRCKARCLSLALTCVAIIVFVNLALMEGLVGDNSERKCTFLPNFAHIADVLNKLDVVFNTAVPMILMFSFSGAASYRLMQGKPIGDRDLSAERPLPCSELLPKSKDSTPAGPVCGGCVDMRHSRHFFVDITTQRACAGCTSVIASYYIRRRPFAETDRRSVFLALVLAFNFLCLAGPHYILQGMDVFARGRQDGSDFTQINFIIQNIAENMANSSYLVNILAFVVLDKYCRKHVRALCVNISKARHISRYFHKAETIDNNTTEAENPL